MNKPNRIDQVRRTPSDIHSIHNGEGYPVILIHGLAASLYDWTDLIPELNKAGYESYAIDLPGHGQSKKPENKTDFNINFVFTSFCNWLEEMQIDHPLTIIGHSLGAYIAIKYALLYPDRVISLILCDPFYTISQLPFILRLNYKYSLIDTSFIAKVPGWMVRYVIDFTSLFIRNGYELPQNIREQTAIDYKRAHPEIFQIVQSIKDLSPFFYSIKQPTLVLWGSRDQTLDIASFPMVLAKIPKASGGAIAGAGHVPHQSHSTEFNQQVLAFLGNLYHPK
ncbi:MAG: alpha/beta hydrolase [Chloroflexi bacterium]|nr:alpha/beta hydrolase [Chloroflexota bacterium]